LINRPHALLNKLRTAGVAVAAAALAEAVAVEAEPQQVELPQARREPVHQPER
jgi:hypothetical protein